jgi:Fe-S cluster biogenesis protein NfuA
VTDTHFQERMQRIEELIAAIQEHGNPVVRASAVEMVRALLDIHGAGLARILERVTRIGAPGDAIVAGFVADEFISRLLLLHGLHPVELETRLCQALDRIRPLLLRHGATAEVVRATHEAVRLRISGGGGDVQQLLEHAILEAAPDVLRIEFVDAEVPASALIPLPLVGES